MKGRGIAARLHAKRKPEPIDLAPGTGPYWHVHHDTLIEWCFSEGERRAFISRNKDEEEIRRRLFRFRPVKQPWPKWLEQAVRLGSLNWLIGKHAAKVRALHLKQCKNCPWRSWAGPRSAGALSGHLFPELFEDRFAKPNRK